MKIHKTANGGEKSSSWKLNFTFATATPPPSAKPRSRSVRRQKIPISSFFAKSFSAKNFRSICMLMMTTMETRQRCQKKKFEWMRIEKFSFVRERRTIYETFCSRRRGRLQIKSFPILCYFLFGLFASHSQLEGRESERERGSWENDHWNLLVGLDSGLSGSFGEFSHLELCHPELRKFLVEFHFKFLSRDDD